MFSHMTNHTHDLFHFSTLIVTAYDYRQRDGLSNSIANKLVFQKLFYS